MTRIIAAMAFAMLLAACGQDTTPKQTTESADTTQPEEAVAVSEAPAQASDPIAMGVEAMTEAEYRRHVETLASDEFGGRAPGSPGEELTVDYLVKHFENLGLEPGNGDSYTQDVPLA